MRVALTDRFVAGAKPLKGAPQTDFFDETIHGLALRVSRSAKSWSLMTTEGGKRRRQTLGYYPVMSLAAARGAAIDTKREGSTAGLMTFAEAFGRFLKAKPRRSLAEVQRRFDKNVAPLIGAVLPRDLTRAEFVVAL